MAGLLTKETSCYPRWHQHQLLLRPTEDAIGMFSEFTPKFVKRFSETGDEIGKAAAKYAKEVKARTFPADVHCYRNK